MRLLDGIGRLYPSTGAAPLTDAAVVLDGERIAWCGPSSPGPPDALTITEHEDLGGCLVTPGLIDAHTHPVYAGDRSAEIALRSTGASYAEIAAAGGGITATVKATRACPLDRLREQTQTRLRSWLAKGTTTVEAKTGYHLEREGELSQVRMLADLRGQPDLPDLVVTFLGAHAVPPDRRGGAEIYALEVATWCEKAAVAGADACDVFCDEGYFTPDQARTVLEAGRAAGLALRVHADELAHTGGARLAAELKATSADHLLHVDKADAAALASARVTATLAPVTALAMGRLPPARMLLGKGVRLALASDHNPGMSGVTDLTVVVALAVASLNLSIDEALMAVTSGAAASLGLDDRGRIEPGKRADLVAWDADHEGAFAWAFGLRPRRVWRAGVAVHGSDHWGSRTSKMKTRTA